MALVIGAFAYSTAEAQYCKPKTTRHRTHLVQHTVRSTPLITTTATATSCRMVPYQVCSILPGRRSVSCYQTTDLDNFTPLPADLTIYGPTGDMPGGGLQSETKTVVVKGKTIGNYCKRDDQGKATTCLYTGPRLVRDEFGYYSYR